MIKLFLLLSFVSITLKGQLDSLQITKAEYPGGDLKLQLFIKNYLVLPKSLEQGKISGKCTIKFTIDTLGNPRDIFVAQGLRGDCDTAAIMVVKQLIGWAPAKIGNRKINTLYTLPFNFKL